MNDARAITADFASLKWVNGRKVLQIICEVPMANTEEVLAILGTPLPGVGTPVQISPLDIEPDIKKDLAKNAERIKQAEKVKRNFEDLPYSQQAALLCKDKQFREHYCTIGIINGEVKVLNEQEAAQKLRETLGLNSRKELDDATNSSARFKFQLIRNRYRVQTGSYPEQRG